MILKCSKIANITFKNEYYNLFYENLDQEEKLDINYDLYDSTSQQLYIH